MVRNLETDHHERITSKRMEQMMKRVMALAAWSALAFGCIAEEALPPTEAQEVVEDLTQAGFPANDIKIVDGQVYVERDAEASLAASPEMLGIGSSCSPRRIQS
jgi:hypothetical protein